MQRSEITKYLNESGIEFKYNIHLKEKTGINGGICAYFCEPFFYSQYLELLSFCIINKINIEVVGNCTNTFFLQDYNPEIVISTIQIKEIFIENDCLICSCGCNLTKLSRNCISDGIAGYEGFIGIPGTIGAAAINNSGAFDSEMSKVVKHVIVLTNDNKIKKLEVPDLKYTRRGSILKDGKPKAYVLKVALDISKKTKVSILQSKANEIVKFRKENVDGKRKSLGSVFDSSTLGAVSSNNKLRTLIKRICFLPFKLIFKNLRRQKINTFLDFLFLGIPKFAKHCDNLNRFCWDKNTTEEDFLNYLKSMQKLANNKLRLEIDIKGNSK